MPVLTFAEMLSALGWRTGEFVSINHEPPCGRFSSVVGPIEQAPGAVAQLGDGVNVWFGCNPTTPRSDGKRGSSAEITRFADLVADLDVKPGACPNYEVAQQIIDDVSGHVGQRPTGGVFSGHGLQAHWSIEDGDITAKFSTSDAARLSRRFGRLIEHVAEFHGVKLDNVSDLARVMRVPGTMNVKDTPVPVVGYHGGGGPLSVAELDERLTELGIVDDGDDDREELSDPSAWAWASCTCGYVAKWLTALPTDGPRAGGGRNPWAASQAVRLCCAWRHGCITEGDFRRATGLLKARLSVLLTTTEPRRALRRFEMRDLFKLGLKRAASKTDDAIRAELGKHIHSTPEDPFGTGSPTGQLPPLEDVVAAGEQQAAAAADGERSTSISGATFVLDQPDRIPTVWGRGNAVLWARGEALMIAGGMGLGKTTLAGQVMHALLFGGEVLGLPVTLADDGIILYLAMDRPRQIARSLRRQFGEQHRDVLARRLRVRQGPPPADLAREPALLTVMAQTERASIVFVDSLKDAAVGLSEDGVGAAYNRARQMLLASGRELCELHHTVKRNATGGAPSTAADIYGATWLTAGAGSVVLLTGEPGDPIVGFRHVKQPAEEVGPYQLLHDQAAGVLTVSHGADLVALVKAAGADGLTARAAAAVLFDKAKPSSADVEKARRRLDGLVDAKRLTRMEGGKGPGNATAWFEA